MFIDKVAVQIKAGDGGRGAVSFRHEKFVDRGGPDGGDGGNGGDVIFMADRNMNTLVSFRFKQELRADDGQAGSKRKMHGRSAKALIVAVPVGTMVFYEGEKIADLVQDQEKAIIARGGKGGYGNAHFISSTRQAPKVAELGEPGQEFGVTLELKLLADVGLVGFPNAGKSTFLSVVTNARPEIADYPFTTLKPQLGVASVDDHSMLIADIPGLIEGASAGKGLGDEFLRHIERTAVLLHLIDIYKDDVAESYQTIRKELSTHDAALVTRPEIVLLTKSEGLDEQTVQQKIDELRSVVPKEVPVFAISSQAHQGLPEVLRAAYSFVATARAQEAAAIEEESDVPVIQLASTAKIAAWRVAHDGGRFVVTGQKIERFAARTDFESEPGLRRLWDIMRKMGILHELERQGLSPGDAVAIGQVQPKTLIYGADGVLQKDK